MESLAWVFRGRVVGFCLRLAVLNDLAERKSVGMKVIPPDERDRGEDVRCR